MKQWSSRRVLPLLLDAVDTVAFTTRGRLVVAGRYWSPLRESERGVTRVVSAEGRIVGHATKHGRSGCVAVHPDGNQFAWSGDRACTLHDLNQRKLPEIRRLTIDQQNAARLLYTPDGQWLIWGGQGGYDIYATREASALPLNDRIRPLLRWKTTDQEPIPLAESGQSVSTLALGADGTALLAGGWDGAVQIWGLARWELLAEWQDPPYAEGNRFPAVRGLQLSPDNRALYVVVGRPPVLRTFRLPEFSDGVEFPHTSAISACLLLHGGRTLVTGSEDCAVTFWNAETGEMTGRYVTEGGVRLSLDKLLGKASGEKKYEQTDSPPPTALAVSPDGAALAVGDAAGRVHLLDLKS